MNDLFNSALINVCYHLIQEMYSFSIAIIIVVLLMELVLVCRCASLDGDADRLVYFSVPHESNSTIDLVDGDKMLSLFAIFIKEQLSFLNEKEDIKDCHQARLGIVQTAYANGASTDYLKHLGLEVNFTPTGVKYLHEKAAEFDIGIYFEANGHGAVLFSESFVRWLEAKANQLSSGSKDLFRGF